MVFGCCKCCQPGEHVHQFPCPNHQTWKSPRTERLDSDDHKPARKA